MVNSSLLKILGGAALCVCLTFVFATLTPSLRADDLPKFAAPEVNDFVKKYTDFVDSFVKAAGAKDDAKMKEISTSMDTWANTAGPAMEGKITAEEKPAFDKWMGSMFEKMMAASPPLK
ncbi:MAG: hypothetical protein M3N12_03915 [Verrucomicrobiota bacterium]|nr:hypothetical protein [Verrucomicrobiota bacterium]